MTARRWLRGRDDGETTTTTRGRPVGGGGASRTARRRPRDVDGARDDERRRPEMGPTRELICAQASIGSHQRLRRHSKLGVCCFRSDFVRARSDGPVFSRGFGMLRVFSGGSSRGHRVAANGMRPSVRRDGWCARAWYPRGVFHRGHAVSSWPLPLVRCARRWVLSRRGLRGICLRAALRRPTFGGDDEGQRNLTRRA